jgi:hypothetical protein
MGGPATSLPDPFNRGDVSKHTDHDRSHHGGPCFPTEPSGPPIKARGRGFVFLQPLLTHSPRFLKTSPQFYKLLLKILNMGCYRVPSPTPSAGSDAPIPATLQEEYPVEPRVLKTAFVWLFATLMVSPDSTGCQDQAVVSGLL